MIQVFNKDNKYIIEDIFQYLIKKNINIKGAEIQQALISNISNNQSHIFWSENKDKIINGILFGYKSDENEWLIQGFFFDYNIIAYELAKFAYKYIKPKIIIYKNFSKNNCHIWNDKKIEKYIEIIS